MSQTIPQENGRAISLMIVGAQKAGTTSLKNYLGQHPALHCHPQKEFSYFFDQSEYDLGFQAAVKKYYPDYSEGEQLIAKSAGLYISEAGIIRLKENNPACKLVLIVRNPVDRTYSSFLMEKNYGAIRDSFEVIESIVRKADPVDWRYEFFIGMSLYCRHLEMIYRHFPKEQVRVVRYLDLEDNPVELCRELFEWMHLDKTFRPDVATRFNETHMNHSTRYGKFLARLLHNNNPIKKLARFAIPGRFDYKVGEILRDINKSKKKYEPVPPRLAAMLSEYYLPYNKRLAELTGMDFSHWNSYLKS
jgi:hypothetical protein